MWADGLRQELDRYRWVLAALPLTGACLSAAALIACRTAADALLHLPDMEDDVVKTCLHDDNDTASPDDDLCASCLEAERAGEALPNRRRPERRAG